MSDYDYGRENGLWGKDGIPYGLDDNPSYNYQRSSAKSYSAVVYKYVQLMKEQGIRTIVDMNKYLTKNSLWNNFSSIVRQNTYSSGFTSMGVSREAYSEIMELYKTEDIIHTRLEVSKRLF